MLSGVKRRHTRRGGGPLLGACLGGRPTASEDFPVSGWGSSGRAGNHRGEECREQMGNSLCKGPGVGGASVPPERVGGWGQITQSHGRDSGLYLQGGREVVVGF